MENVRLVRDETAQLVSRDQIDRRERRHGRIHLPCSVDHGQDWQPYPIHPYSAECVDHTYLHAATLQVFKFGYQDSSRPVKEDGMPWGCVAHAAGVLDGILKFFYAR